MVASPPVGATRPSSIRGVVVLPAPLGPRKPVTRPGSTVKDRSLTAARSPYCLVSRETTTRPGLTAGGGSVRRRPVVGQVDGAGAQLLTHHRHRPGRASRSAAAVPPARPRQTAPAG